MRLVIDSASSKVQVGLIDADSGDWKDIQSHQEDKPQQSKLIFKLIDRLLSEQSIDPDQLDSLAVNLGPGSYTGLRVGLSVVKTWAYAFSLPLYSFSIEDERELDCLGLNDFSKVENVVKLEPLYKNDHFGANP